MVEERRQRWYLAPLKDSRGIEWSHSIYKSMSIAVIVVLYKFTDTPIDNEGWSTLSAHAVGKLPCGSQPTALTCVVWSCRLIFAAASVVKGRVLRAFGLFLPDGIAMLMRPNKTEVALHSLNSNRKRTRYESVIFCIVIKCRPSFTKSPSLV